LYLQLTGAARKLNYGYYAWRAGGILSWGFADGSVKIIAPGLNPGTVGVQAYFAGLLSPADWTKAVSQVGFSLTYGALFGNPFRRAVEPLVPPDLVQPTLQLPFEPGKEWSYTGGPHAAWDVGSAWAALDFAPPGNALGCVPSDEWVVASAPGLVVRSVDGAVLVDLDGDGYEQTGWVLFYMHIESRDRVPVGTQLKSGDRIGHPSCEGGVSQGTHAHFARKYNGEWIAADGPIPFVLDGWVSQGLGAEYDGTLTRAGMTLEACDCRGPGNQISRP
jgi:murein DD-endopeptidase MepM/ murein hydrolase activator NlpD